MESRGRERYEVIDLLRFGAAVGVMMYHFTASGPLETGGNHMLAGPRDIFPLLEPVTRFGFLGVELFFIISGFVILSSALNRSALQFAASRFSRIYPTYWAGMAFTLLCLAWFLGSTFHLGLREIVANALLLQQVFGIPHIDGVYWTLWVELQFYGWMFLLILFGLLRFIKVWLVLWLAITVLHLITGFPEKMGYFIHPGYSSLFIAGAVFSLATREGFKSYHVTMLLAAWVVSVRYAFPHADTYINNVALSDRIVSGAVVTCFHLVFLCVSLGKLRVRGSRLATMLGGLTFPLYVVHHQFGRHAIDALHQSWPPYAILFFVIGVSLVVAYGIYLLVDKNLAVRLRALLDRAVARVGTATGARQTGG